MFLKHNDFVSKKLKLFFYCVQILFSLDFGFVSYKSNRQNFFIKLSTAFVGLSISVLSFILIIFAFVQYEFIPWFIKDSIQYFVQVCVLLFTPKSASFFSYLKKLHYIDTKLGVDSYSYRLDIKIISACVATSLFKILVSSIYCLFFYVCNKSIYTSNLPILIPYISLEYPLITYFFVFDASCFRLIILRKVLKKKRFGAKYFQRLYMLLIDSTEKIKNTFDIIVSFLIL